MGGLRITGGKLAEQRLLFVGAGEAGIGTADTFVAALVEEGVSAEDARNCCYFVDSKGLLVTGRKTMASHKQPYAKDHPAIDDLLEVIQTLKPTVIIGLSGQPGTFSKAIIEIMSAINERPIIFALSNPTSKAECTAEQAYSWSGGRAIFASGSPFEPVTYANQTYIPGQGNNVYIFPGVGLGAIVSGASRVTDEMFLVAAHTLAKQVSENELSKGCVYPPLSMIREVSAEIAYEVAKLAWSQGLTDKAQPGDIMAEIKKQMFKPVYPHYA